jgi:peptide/nickel transport system permease protein
MTPGAPADQTGNGDRGVPGAPGREGQAGRLRRILPGLGRLRRGDRTGLPILFGWLAGIAIAAGARARIAATLRDGSIDEWLALATLIALLGMSWWAGNRHGRTQAASSTVGQSGWDIAWRRLGRHRTALVGLWLVIALCAIALLAPYLAPLDPDAMPPDLVASRFLAPSLAHPMGTDRFGRDILSRVIYGSRVSLSIGFLAVGIAITIGTLLGAVSGYVGRWVDALTMRLVDVLLSFPRLVLLIFLVAVFEPSLALVTLVLGLTGWMGTARIVRGEVLSVREREYVEAARALGYGDRRIVLRHILPNVLSPVIVTATLLIGNTILAEAALSFLGLSVQPPTATWGNIIADGNAASLVDAWWITTFPGLAIVITVMCLNLVGDGLRDALDPRSER